jgi:hypothetical protein
MKTEFTPALIAELSKMLGVMFDGHFAYIVTPNATVTDCDEPGDTLVLGDYSIIRSHKLEERKTILGLRSFPIEVFSVFVTKCVAQQTRWEPADYDDFLVGEARSIYDALAMICGNEVKQTFANQQEYETVTAAYGNPEEQ